MQVEGAHQWDVSSSAPDLGQSGFAVVGWLGGSSGLLGNGLCPPAAVGGGLHDQPATSDEGGLSFEGILGAAHFMVLDEAKALVQGEAHDLTELLKVRFELPGKGLINDWGF